MAINKVVYKDKTLIDLTKDTVTPSSMLEDTVAHDSSGKQIVGAIINLSDDTVSPSTLKKGITAHDSSGQQIVGTMDVETSGGVDTSDATATELDILEGKTAYVDGIKINGNMSNIGTLNIGIMRKGDFVNIPKGYHNGNGHAKINDEEQLKIIPENIKSGVSILGVEGILQAGGGKKLKIGTTTSTTINTGLSSVNMFILYVEKIQGVGLVSTIYKGESTSVSTICAEYSVYTKLCGTIESRDFEIENGTIIWNGSEFYGDHFMSGITYNWIAVGE